MTAPTMTSNQGMSMAVADVKKTDVRAVTLNRHKAFKTFTPDVDTCDKYVRLWLKGWFEVNGPENDQLTEALEFKDVVHKLSWTGLNIWEMEGIEMESRLLRCGCEEDIERCLVADILSARELSVSKPLLFILVLI